MMRTYIYAHIQLYSVLNILPRALSVGIGQNLLLSKLMTAVPHYTDAVTEQDVISAGAAGLAQIAPDAAVLSALR